MQESEEPHSTQGVHIIASIRFIQLESRYSIFDIFGLLISLEDLSGLYVPSWTTYSAFKFWKPSVQSKAGICRESNLMYRYSRLEWTIINSRRPFSTPISQHPKDNLLSRGQRIRRKISSSGRRLPDCRVDLGTIYRSSSSIQSPSKFNSHDVNSAARASSGNLGYLGVNLRSLGRQNTCVKNRISLTSHETVQVKYCCINGCPWVLNSSRRSSKAELS